jgi:hypothetical protein
MSSQAQGTGIILDDETGEWTRIKIDPNHEKFLRIYYTSDKDKGGFDGPLTYNIYKPVTVTNSEGLKVEIPEWEDISQLMDNIIHLNRTDEYSSVRCFEKISQKRKMGRIECEPVVLVD